MRGDFTFDVGWRRRLGQERRDRARRGRVARLVVVAARLRRPRPGPDDARLARGARGAGRHPRRYGRRGRQRPGDPATGSRRATYSRSFAPTSAVASRPHGRCASIRARCPPSWTRGFVPLAPPPPPEPDRVPEVTWVASLAALALGFGLLVAAKGRAFAAACAARGVRARSVVGLPTPVRAVAAGLGLAAGVGLQGFGALNAGALLVALATLAAASRPPGARVAGAGPWPLAGLAAGRGVQGRGRHRGPLARRRERERDGGRRGWPARSLLSPESRRVTSVTSVRRARGSSCSMRPRSSRCSSPDARATCRPTARGPRRPGSRRCSSDCAPIVSLRVAPWARVVLGGSTIDELRLLVLPRVVMPGVVGIEIGRAWSTTPAGWAATPEVLVRVLEGSSAAAKLAQVLPRARSLPGRRADERVVRLRPRAGTRASTLALTRGLAEALTDRRAAAPARVWEGPAERRLPRPAAPASAAPMAPAKAC